MLHAFSTDLIKVKKFDSRSDSIFRMEGVKPIILFCSKI